MKNSPENIHPEYEDDKSYLDQKIGHEVMVAFGEMYESADISDDDYLMIMEKHSEDRSDELKMENYNIKSQLLDTAESSTIGLKSRAGYGGKSKLKNRCSRYLEIIDNIRDYNGDRNAEVALAADILRVHNDNLGGLKNNILRSTGRDINYYSKLYKEVDQVQFKDMRNLVYEVFSQGGLDPETAYKGIYNIYGPDKGNSSNKGSGVYSKDRLRFSMVLNRIAKGEQVEISDARQSMALDLLKLPYNKSENLL